MPSPLLPVSKKTHRVERHWISGRICDLDVYEIPLEKLYFNIENGRYADRMLRLRDENPGIEIDPRADRWKDEIEKMLAGEHPDTSRDRAAFETLLEDLKAREQIRPGVVLVDGGVIDGNRRLAALRRLWKESKNTARYRHFHAVILPENTTPEDRWKIEAGLQLSTNERWNYPPINELLKVREGIQLYQAMIGARKLPATESPFKLVAKAIYGKSESDVREMMDRLSMIDEYLEAIEQPGAYDRVGQRSEDFLEACKVMTAAENRQLDPQFLAKLKLGLFYLIDQDQMDNWQIRKIYQSLGGDPKKKGRKPRENMPALQELLETLPEPAAIQEELVRIRQPFAADDAPEKPPIDPVRVEAGVERFLRKTSDRTKPLSAVAEGAQADVEELEKSLSERKRREALGIAERDSIAHAIESMTAVLKKCKLHLKKIHPSLPFREDDAHGVVNGKN